MEVAAFLALEDAQVEDGHFDLLKFGLFFTCADLGRRAHEFDGNKTTGREENLLAHCSRIFDP